METTDFNKARWAEEYAIFRKAIAAASPDRLDWQPDSKSRSTRRLIGHMIGHLQDLSELVDDGVIHHRNEVPFDTLDEALDLFDRSYQDMRSKLDTLDAEGWAEPADFLAPDGSLIANAPRESLSWLFLFDSIHHRGQLTTHLRPTGARVPALYGPSADEGMPGGH